MPGSVPPPRFEELDGSPSNVLAKKIIVPNGSISGKTVTISGGGGITVGTTTSNGTANTLLKTSGTGTVTDATGIVGNGTNQTLKVTAQAATDVPVTVKLAASQSANALEVQPNGSTTPVFKVDASGNNFGGSSIVTNGVDYAIGGNNLTLSYSSAIGLSKFTNNASDALGLAGFANAILTRSDWQFAWSPNTGLTTGPDIGLGRAAAGVVKLTNGSTGSAALSSVPLSPTALSANADNYNPGTARHLRISATTPVNLTGIVAGQDGQELFIWNVGATNTITIVHQATSTAANQFFTTTGANLALAAGKCAIAMYDGTTARWRVSLLP